MLFLLHRHIVIVFLNRPAERPEELFDRETELKILRETISSGALGI